MKTITGKVFVLLAPHSSLTPQQITDGDGSEIFGELSFVKCELPGYATLGTVELSVEIPDVNTILGIKVEQLRTQLRAEQAKSELQCSRIREQINNLLAIEFKPETEDVT